MKQSLKTASLQSNVIGLLGLATMGTVMLSPAMTLYGNFGPSFLYAGRAAPLAFIWALIATIPTAVSYAILARDYPDSGSAANWVSRYSPQWVAKWAGLLVFMYYFNNFIIQPVTLGVFLNDFLTTAGVQSGFFTYALGAILCCAWPAWIVYRGISVSSHGATGFLLFETAVVLGLCATVLYFGITHGVHFSTEGFTVHASPHGISGIFHGMIFGVLAFCGFDVISTLSEEAEAPKKLIPQATFLALAVFGVMIISGVWILTYSADPEKLRAVADAGGMPISEIARIYWGKWAQLVPLTAISASLGIAIATAVGSSRILFSMARKGDAPASLAVLHEKYNVPWNAMNLIFIVGLIAALATGALLGPYDTYVWWGATSTFFAMLTYLMVNLSNLYLFRERVFSSPLAFLLHGVIPVFGIGADGFILIRAFFIELWNSGFKTGQSVVLFDIAITVVALAYALKR